MQNLNPFLYKMEVNLVKTESTVFMVTTYEGSDINTPTGQSITTTSISEVDEFTKVYQHSYINGLLKQFGNSGRHLFLYIIYNLKKDKDIIDLNMTKICSILGIKERTYYMAVNELVLSEVIEKCVTSRKAYEYWINPKYFYIGDRKKYFADKNPNACKIVKTIPKNQVATVGETADTKILKKARTE